MSTQTERKICKSNQPHLTLRRITHQITAFKHSPELSPDVNILLKGCQDKLVILFQSAEKIALIN